MNNVIKIIGLIIIMLMVSIGVNSCYEFGYRNVPELEQVTPTFLNEEGFTVNMLTSYNELLKINQ